MKLPLMALLGADEPLLHALVRREQSDTVVEIIIRLLARIRARSRPIGLPALLQSLAKLADFIGKGLDTVTAARALRRLVYIFTFISLLFLASVFGGIAGGSLFASFAFVPFEGIFLPFIGAFLLTINLLVVALCGRRSTLWRHGYFSLVTNGHRSMGSDLRPLVD